jgi:hypothetical protein
MSIRLRVCAVFAAVLWLLQPASGQAQQQKPAAAGTQSFSPATMILAKELIDLKGAGAAFDPLLTGVIEYHKNFFMQTNPNLSKELNEVARKLAADLAPRRSEMQQQLTRIYASHFTEQELKDALAFFKTPLGRKLISEEPKALEAAMKAADDWSRKLAEEVVAKFRAEMKRRGHNLI